MSKKKKVVNIIIVILVAIFCAILTLVLVPLINSLRTEEGKIQMENFINSLGLLGPIIFIIAEIIQIIVALVPGGPVEVIGGAVFGPVKGLILCEIGIFTATVIIYSLVKKFGKSVVNSFVSEEKFKKFKFLHDEKKIEIIFFILMLIPGTPKDVITYIGALTDIKRWRFSIIVVFARIPALLLCVTFGNSIYEKNYLLAAIVFIVTAAIGITGILLNNKITAKRREKVEKMKKLENQLKEETIENNSDIE